jgi:tetratricopeptide (TPR) repeat protein
MKRLRFTTTWAVLLLVGLTFAAYLNCLANAFVWDDELLVVQNPYIRNVRYLGAVFTTDLFHNDADWDATHYRPLQTVSYLADYRFWGLDPVGYHLTNVLLHLGCALLVFALVGRWFGDRWLAFGVAAIFAVHPINTNAVTFIAGRADPLALLGLLAALWCVDRYLSRGAWGWFVAAVLAATAALFSRESAMLLPALVLWYGLAVRRNWREAVRLALVLAVLVAGFFWLRHEMLGWQGRSTHAVWHLPVLVRAQVAMRALASYLGLLAWPARLQMERQLLFGSPHLHWLTVAGFVSVAGLGALAWWSRQRARPVWFGLGWFALALAPMLGVVNLNATFAEHWVYTASIGLYLAAFALLRQWRGAPVLLTLVLLALVARTYRRNQDWADPVRFYARTAVAAPDSATARQNFARQLSARGNTNAARAEFAAAEQMNPGNARAKTSAAFFLWEQGELPAARAKIEESLALSPHSTRSLLIAAAIAEDQADWPTAERHYARALAAITNVRPWLLYGGFLRRRGRLVEARALADTALRLEPGSAPAWNLSGAVLAEQGDLTGAAAAFAQARRCDRWSTDGYVNQARLALRQGRQREALEWIDRALALAPDDPRLLASREKLLK